MKTNLYNKLYCPACTTVEHYEGDYTYAGRSENPVFLIRKTNKKTNDWFYGCPNYPKCKYTLNRPKTKEERDIKVWAWANAQEGPHY